MTIDSSLRLLFIVTFCSLLNFLQFGNDIIDFCNILFLFVQVLFFFFDFVFFYYICLIIIAFPTYNSFAM